MSLRAMAMLAAITTSSVIAQGKVLLYEGFDYTPGQSVAGNEGGFGWDAGDAWQVGGDAGGSSTGEEIGGGLTFADLPTMGGALQMNTNHNGQGGQQVGNLTAARRVGSNAVVPVSTWLYTSFLFQKRNTAQDDDIRGEEVVQISTSATAGSTKFRHRVKNRSWTNNATAHDKAGIGYNGSITGTADAVALQQTYLAIAEFANVNKSGDQQAKIWILSEDDWNAIDHSDGLSTADLNANHTATATSAWTGNVMLNATDFLQMEVSTEFGKITRVTYDEFRLMESLADITTPIPEPATLVLLGAAGLMVRCRRA